MKIKFPNAAFFDLDDTILATKLCSSECWELLSEEYAPFFHQSGHSDITPANIVESINNFRLWFWSDKNRNKAGRLNPENALLETINGGLELLGIKDLEASKIMADKWNNLRWSKLKPLPKAIETIKELKSAGVRLALITNGNVEIQSRKISKLGLENLMDHIHIEGEFGIGKPEPAVYLNALKQLDVIASQTWMAGDNIEFDVIAPMKLGIYGIWVDSNDLGLESHDGTTPDLVVKSISELI